MNQVICCKLEEREQKGVRHFEKGFRVESSSAGRGSGTLPRELIPVSESDDMLPGRRSRMMS